MGNPRRLGVQAARNRYKTMAAGHSLPEYKQEMLKLTARLMIHALNASSRIMEEGEETERLPWEEDEPTEPPGYYGYYDYYYYYYW